MGKHLQHLHDKATRGVALSESEQAQLETWYRAQDEAEGQTLAASGFDVSNLRAQITASIEQIAAAAKHIQELSAQNDALRLEIAALQRLLISRAA